MSAHLRSTLQRTEIPKVVKRIRAGQHPRNVAKDFGLHPEAIYNFLPKRLRAKVEAAEKVAMKEVTETAADRAKQEAEDAKEVLEQELSDAETRLDELPLESEEAQQLSDEIIKLKEVLEK